jgi:hypothetical protein
VIRVLTVAVLVLIVADVVGIATIAGDDNTRPPLTAGATSTKAASPTTAAQPAPPTSTTVPDQLATLVHQLQVFVEQHRGLKFKQPLKVTLLADAKFRARVLALAKEDDSEIVRTGNELRALGLLKPNVDLRQARDALLGGAIVGLYDPKTRELLVRGSGITPHVRTTLAHEITHALQDQNFHIDHPEYEKREDEISIGFSAIAEGDALRVEELYRGSMSRRDQQTEAVQERDAAGGVDYSKIPPVLLQLLIFPYANGPVIVSALLKAGGQPRLDAAFGKPPTTTEQVLHPEKFVAGEGPKPVADPSADGAAIDKGVMGELVLKLLLANAVSPDVATAAATGWGGDRYVAWTKGDQTCVRTSFVMDSPSDTQELRAALGQWVSRQKAASLSASDPPTLTSCA